MDVIMSIFISSLNFLRPELFTAISFSSVLYYSTSLQFFAFVMSVFHCKFYGNCV